MREIETETGSIIGKLCFKKHQNYKSVIDLSRKYKALGLMLVLKEQNKNISVRCRKMHFKRSLTGKLRVEEEVKTGQACDFKSE